VLLARGTAVFSQVGQGWHEVRRLGHIPEGTKFKVVPKKEKKKKPLSSKQMIYKALFYKLKLPRIRARRRASLPQVHPSLSNAKLQRGRARFIPLLGLWSVSGVQTLQDYF
jgi:hypothetical protein